MRRRLDYEPTDVAIAIVANVSPDIEQHDRAFATKLLEQQSKRASSLIQRVNARAALLTGKRDRGPTTHSSRESSHH